MQDATCNAVAILINANDKYRYSSEINIYRRNAEIILKDVMSFTHRDAAQ